MLCKLNPHNDTTIVLLTTFCDENLKTKESKICSYWVTRHWDLNLTLSPGQFLFLPATISTIPSHCCLSIAIPIYATSLVFSSIFFVGICLGSSRRLNFLMEGTLFVPFLYSPDNHYCCREAQSLRTLPDLLKVTSNQHRSKFKHKYSKKHQLSFNLSPL